MRNYNPSEAAFTRFPVVPRIKDRLLTDFDRIGGVSGIMPSQWIVEAIARGVIQASSTVQPEQIQPNSLDLRLDSTAHRVNCSFLPGAEGVAKKLSRFRWYDVPLTDRGAVLERNQVYLIPLA